MKLLKLVTTETGIEKQPKSYKYALSTREKTQKKTATQC